METVGTFLIVNVELLVLAGVGDRSTHKADYFNGHAPPKRAAAPRQQEQCRRPLSFSISLGAPRQVVAF